MKSPIFEDHHQQRKKTKPNKNKNCWQSQSAGHLPATGYGLKSMRVVFQDPASLPLTLPSEAAFPRKSART